MMGMGLISPVLPLYARSFGVSITMVGLLITVFGVARFVADIPAGRLADRFGRHAILVAGPLILAVSSVACGLASNYWELLTFRFLQGVGSATYNTAAMIMLADMSTPANRGRVMSLFQGSSLVGNGLGPTMGGFIAQYWGPSAPFFVLALFAILAALWSHLRLPETRPALSPAVVLGGSSGPRSPLAIPGTRLRSLLLDPNFVLISVVTFGIFLMETGARSQLFPLLASDRLESGAAEIGIGLTIVSVIRIMILFVSGRLSDRLGRKAVIVPGCLISVAALVMLSQTYSYWFLLLTCVIWGIGAGVAGPTPAAYVADITPKENYASAMSLYRTAGDLGFVVGPVLLGWLADVRGYSFSLLFNGLFLLLAVCLFQILAKEPSRSRGAMATA